MDEHEGAWLKSARCGSNPKIIAVDGIKPEWKPTPDARVGLEAECRMLCRALRRNSEATDPWVDPDDGSLSAECCRALLIQSRCLEAGAGR